MYAETREIKKADLRRLSLCPLNYLAAGAGAAGAAAGADAASAAAGAEAAGAGAAAGAAGAGAGASVLPQAVRVRANKAASRAERVIINYPLVSGYKKATKISSS